MKVLVLLDVGADVRIPPERDPRSGRVREDRLVRQVDPACARALDLALALTADRPNRQVSVVHLGPPENEPFLRDALARGCSRAIRVWDEEAGAARTAGKAAVLAAAVQAVAPDLVFCGDRGVIGAGGQLGVLLAAQLGMPCVTEVGAATLSADAHRLTATRELERGFHEIVEAALPLVLTVAAGATGEAAPPVPLTARAKLAALDEEIPVWTLADLGVMPGTVRDADRPLEPGSPGPRQPRLHPVAAPDPTLPAFDRILALVQGSVKSRGGRVVCGSGAEVAQEVFEVLRDEGWLDHLRPGGSSRSSGGPGSRPPAGPDDSR
jgi:electron transfer flavoprotein beta subunit